MKSWSTVGSAPRGAERGDGVGGDVVERLRGVGDHGDAVALDRQRRDPDREVDRRHAELGEPPDPLDPGAGVRTSRRRRARRRTGDGAGWSSRAGRRRARSRRRRTRCRRRSGSPARVAASGVPSASSETPFPNSAVAQRPPIWRSAVGEDPRDRPERVLVAAHRPGGVNDQPDVRLLDRGAHLPDDPPRMGADRPAGGLLGAAACVGAAVEAAARGALVDLPRPPGDRLAQPVGVAAGVLHLIGERRPVDAAVGQPAARQPGRPPAAELRSPRSPRLRRRARSWSRSTSSSSCSSCRRAAVAIACSSASASEPAPAPPSVPAPSPSPRVASPPPSPDPAGLRGPPVIGGGSGSPTIRRYSRAASSRRSSSPSGIHRSLA